MTKKELKKQLKYKSISLDTTKFIMLVKYIDEQKVAMMKSYTSFDINVKLKGDIVYTVHDSVELSEIFKSEFDSIQSIDFRFYSSELVIYLETYFNGVQVTISGDKEKVILAFDEFKKTLNSSINWNWVVSSYWLQVTVPVLIASSLIVLLVLNFQNYFKDYGIMKAVIIGVVIQLSIFVLLTYFERYYPKLILVKNNIKTGRDFRNDWWKIVAWIVGVPLVGIFINKVSSTLLF